MSDEVRTLVEKAIAENQELRNSVIERDAEIQRLTEQLNKTSTEDSEILKQRFKDEIKKVKADFRTMYEGQSKFFLDKIELLKREQRANIAKIYEH